MMSEASLCECPQLKDMTKEEIINYFKTKMTNMKKEHEMKVREMTEEYDSFNREVIKELVSSNLRKDNEKERGDHLEEKLLKNEDAFEKEKAYLSALLEEKEKSMSEMGSRLTEQRKHLELVHQELNRETNLISSRLDEAFERIGLYEVDVTELDQKLKVAANDLREAKKETSLLHGVIQKLQNMIGVAVANEGEQRKNLESSFASILGLAKSMDDFECRVTEKIMQNCSRLDMLDLKCRPFAQKANLHKRKRLEYKQKLERRCSDLQMAENKVDLLADKVDVLQSLLSKIDTALDRYSLILQNYPGMPKYYVVFVGRRPGIYTSWEEARLQVEGFRGNNYRSFTCFEDAMEEWDNFLRSRTTITSGQRRTIQTSALADIDSYVNIRTPNSDISTQPHRWTSTTVTQGTSTEDLNMTPTMVSEGTSTDDLNPLVGTTFLFFFVSIMVLIFALYVVIKL